MLFLSAVLMTIGSAGRLIIVTPTRINDLVIRLQKRLESNKIGIKYFVCALDPSTPFVIYLAPGLQPLGQYTSGRLIYPKKKKYCPKFKASLLAAKPPKPQEEKEEIMKKRKDWSESDHGTEAHAAATRPEIVERFHEGVENARNIIGVLKKEKWRLSRREMSVEMRMGELEDYKSHLQNDMSSLNQTVDVLSMRVVQLENQLVEAQETQEQLEAEILEHKRSIEDYKAKLTDSLKKNTKLKKNFELLEAQTPHTLITENTMVKNEIAVLMDENQKLKELIRSAETVSPAASDDHLTRLTRDFLRQLSSLDDETEHTNLTDEQPNADLDVDANNEAAAIT
ncbi:hypothetical protein PoB_000942900 [Plakobranchus ocellatus]|uniref:Uncharacterized protein n=1 Tax=Plakobranchus ocellatus TaxID=259542 RepID=A0AAV3YLB3_9GAST|nr:hypothetical protein PoB_000942900 [Plakobranchus ocellatus]